MVETGKFSGFTFKHHLSVKYNGVRWILSCLGKMFDLVIPKSSCIFALFYGLLYTGGTKKRY